jgi:hypothetical protein
LVDAKGIQMKNILIISPHYPPSNLAAVHRSRLFAQHLPSFGWKPIILTVHEKFYEEKLDWNLFDLIPNDQRIEKVKAFIITKPRIIGDIGLRGFFQLRRRALEILKSEKIDFVYIPIPSFYIALIGPYLFKKTGVRYGIDYIDPWVHHFPGSEKLFSRHCFSTMLAKILEPIAVKHVSLITGVSEGYYNSVLDRNPHLKTHAETVAMPYGGEESDHLFVKAIPDVGQQNSLIPFKKDKNTFRFIYAGAMLPKAYKPLEEIFKSLSSSLHNDSQSPIQNLEFFFIGTLGTIEPFAKKYNLWGKVVFEYPERIPYLDVLKILSNADGIFILGSTEPHYTPSKLYQGVLSQKPVLAVLHQQSSAVGILNESGAGKVILMNGEEDLHSLSERFSSQLLNFLTWVKNYDYTIIQKDVFSLYSAKSVTAELANGLNRICHD